MRSLIQYDLDEPPTAHTPALGPHTPPSWPTRRPPAKKRKRHPYNPRQAQLAVARETPPQHWDDPGSAAFGMVYDEQEGSTGISAPPAAGADTVSYADSVEGEEDYGEEPAVEGGNDIDVEEEEEEESRLLTQEEIWDDAALIDAWNSAEAEYEAYHGTSKVWKTEPVKKSPLWYNKPYTAPTPQAGPCKPKARSKADPSQMQEESELEPDTAPLDFDTFVPTHDPSLVIPSNAGSNLAMNSPSFIPPPSTTMVGRDEAFNNALSAMYWSGYWTAVYHCQSQSSRQGNDETAGATEVNQIEADEDEEDLVPAQR